MSSKEFVIVVADAPIQRGKHVKVVESRAKPVGGFSGSVPGTGIGIALDNIHVGATGRIRLYKRPYVR